MYTIFCHSRDYLLNHAYLREGGWWEQFRIDGKNCPVINRFPRNIQLKIGGVLLCVYPGSSPSRQQPI